MKNSFTINITSLDEILYCLINVFIEEHMEANLVSLFFFLCGVLDYPQRNNGVPLPLPRTFRSVYMTDWFRSFFIDFRNKKK